MKAKQSFEPHLVLKQMTLLPGSELQLMVKDWCVVLVKSGVGYWMQSRANHELLPGMVGISSDREPRNLRASQVSTLALQFFRIQPDRLTGLITLGEQEFLHRAALQPKFMMRLFAPTSLIAEKCQVICEQEPNSNLPARLAMLELFVETFGKEWRGKEHVLAAPLDAKARLLQLLDETEPSELLNLSFSDLVQRTRCTPRHLSRLFHQVMGMSFRQKQAQVRLLRAQELLATTETKMVEVALESGYPSPCLFNTMFKRQFGVTPAKWRDRARNLKAQSRDTRS